MMRLRPTGAAFISALLILGACGEAVEETTERLRPVRFVTVHDDSVFRDRSFAGTSKSVRESRLSFKVSGTVINVPVQIGQRLQAGDLIAEIDPTSFALQVQQAQAALLEAEANERRAVTNYERTKGLYANDSASLNDLEATRAQSESARAVVSSATKALEIARLNASYTRLTADSECTIASLNIEVNENASPGQQVAAVSCGDEFEVTLDLPESLIKRVDESTPVSIVFNAIPGEVFDGDITEIAFATATGSAGFPVVIQVLGEHASLRSGLAANVTFQLDSAAVGGDGVVIPVNAIINDGDGTFVFVAAPTGTEGEATVERRAVSVGELSQNGIEVVNGLSLGDRVITAGLTAIREGQKVLVSQADRG